MHLNVLLIPVYTIFSDRSLTAGWISKDVVGRIVYSALSDCDNLTKSQKCSDLRNTGSSNFSECPHGTFVVAFFSSLNQTSNLSKVIALHAVHLIDLDTTPKFRLFAVSNISEGFLRRIRLPELPRFRMSTRRSLEY